MTAPRPGPWPKTLYSRASKSLTAANWVLCTLLFADQSILAQPVDFNADVLPILSRNCFHCHGPDDKSREADLRLDTRAGALRVDNPLITPGNSDTSPLIQRITSNDPDMRMPPASSKQQLTAGEIEVLRRWISEGAAWSEHWSFLPLKRHLPPIVDHKDWPRTGVDNFIVARLEQQKLSPSSEAIKETSLRRTSFDLIGLPPTREERNDFLVDDRPDAYERVVDRLLASPHFGERWGRHWLDVARYADSSGFEGDPPRSVWKFRDWVINAMNEDLPFDEFVIKQLAGHLLPDSTVDDRIATGFLLNSQQDGGSEPSRLDAVVDRVNTIGTVFLGLTVGCAQCHTHKFDPLTHREYYSLFAFVNSADEFKLEFAPPEELARRDALTAQVTSLTAERTTYAANLPADKLKSDPGYQERTATIELLRSRIPEIPSTLVLQAVAPERVTTTFVRGEFARPGEAVSPGVPHVLPPLCVGPLKSNHGRSLIESRVDVAEASELRSNAAGQDATVKPTPLDLARWLVSSDQPLTPRVTVNRVWQQLFGRGLVETENDFGTQGARPTHPELLDWLSTEFQRGWQFKGFIRRVVESATYRQQSNRRVDLEQIDPDNRLLARQSRLRLEAESIRDVALAVGGMLSTKIGGPSVFPFQHDGIMLNRATPAPWTMSPGEDRYRRGLYTYYWRLTPNPQLQTFDAPDSITACTRRQTSNTPLQALAILNEPTFTEAAEKLAGQLRDRQFNRDHDAIEFAFETCVSRKPNGEELQLLDQILNTARSRFTLTTSGGSSESKDTAELAAWTQLTRTIINLEEFIVRE